MTYGTTAKNIQCERKFWIGADFSCKCTDLWCVLRNHGLGWIWLILIFVENRQILIIMRRISQPWNPKLIQGMRNRLLNLKFQKMSFFTFLHFLLCWKVYFSSWATGSVKSSHIDYNESNKTNPKSWAYIKSKKSLVELRVPKNNIFLFFFPHFLLYWKFYFFTLSRGFLKRITFVLILQCGDILWFFFIYFLIFYIFNLAAMMSLTSNRIRFSREMK